MSSVVARQSIHIPLLWCDADELGAFVDYLSELIQPEVEAAAEAAPILSMSESIRERSLPRWWLSMRRDRRLNIDGPYADVKRDTDLARARRLSVTIGTTSTTQFNLETDLWGGSLNITALSERWLDTHLPAVRERARMLTPRWARFFSKRFFGVLFAIAWGLSAISTLSPILQQSSIFAVATFACIVVGAAGCALPALRLGPRPRSIWMKVVGFTVGAVVAGVIGAVISRLLFPTD